MATRARRPCLGLPDRSCHNLSGPGAPRCDQCETEYQRERNAARPQYRGDWPRQAKADIATYRATHGDVCPGWRRAPHDIDPTDWTCDHDNGPMCRSCNSRKGAVHDRPRRQAAGHHGGG